MAKLDTLIPTSDLTHQQIEAKRAILTRLAQGEREIARGEGYDLDHVLNEADSLLRLPRK